MGFGAGSGDQLDRLAIEAGEDLSAEPAAFEGDDPAAKSPPSASIADPASIAGRSVATPGLLTRATIAWTTSPAGRWYARVVTQTNSHSADSGIAMHSAGAQQFRRAARLLAIVEDRNPHEDVCIDRDSQSSAAQPLAMTLLISSIVRGLVPGRYRAPMKSSIEPVGFARTSMRPFGSMSTSTFWPGPTPRCRNTSLRRVTCPFAVTATVVAIIAS